MEFINSPQAEVTRTTLVPSEKYSFTPDMNMFPLAVPKGDVAELYIGSTRALGCNVSPAILSRRISYLADCVWIWCLCHSHLPSPNSPLYASILNSLDSQRRYRLPSQCFFGNYNISLVCCHDI